MIYRCWRCTRGLGIYAPPPTEALTVICQRCKAKNIVRAGCAPAEPIEGRPVSSGPVVRRGL